MHPSRIWPCRFQSLQSQVQVWPNRIGQIAQRLGKSKRSPMIKAVGRADRPALTTLSRPFLPRFPPFFRRSFALSGFLAPRRRKWAKNGVKWAKNGQDRRLVSSALAALPTAPPMMPAHCRSLLAVDLPSVSSRASVLRAGLGKGHYTAFAKPGPAVERGGSPGPGDEEPAPGTGEWGACRRDSFVDSDKDALVRRRCIVGSDMRCFGCSGVQ